MTPPPPINTHQRSPQLPKLLPLRKAPPLLALPPAAAACPPLPPPSAPPPCPSSSEETSRGGRAAEGERWGRGAEDEAAPSRSGRACTGVETAEEEEATERREGVVQAPPPYCPLPPLYCPPVLMAVRS